MHQASAVRLCFGLRLLNVQDKEVVYMAKVFLLFVSLLVVANLVSACATHQRVQTDTVQYEDQQRAGDPVTVERRTTTTTQTSSTEDSGVLSGTVNVIGEVLALPFRAVGGLLRAIF
jgi:hypothetical protein